MAALGGSPDEIETQFFDAMQKGDIAQLMACWADEDDIACIHPGGARLLGANAIRASFESVFAHRELRVQIDDVARVEVLGSAAHTLLLRIGIELPDGLHEARLVVTHAYQKTPLGWRLVVHHASALPSSAESAAPGSANASGSGGATPHMLH